MGWWDGALADSIGQPPLLRSLLCYNITLSYQSAVGFELKFCPRIIPFEIWRFSPHFKCQITGTRHILLLTVLPWKIQMNLSIRKRLILGVYVFSMTWFYSAYQTILKELIWSIRLQYSYWKCWIFEGWHQIVPHINNHFLFLFFFFFHQIINR